jgi:ribose/xylose/arabinose/galactoside ABC-type transport system permease subunit
MIEVDPRTDRDVRPRRRHLEQRALSVVYVLLGVIVLFGVWQRGQFLSWATIAAVSNNSAIAGLVALSLLLTLASGLFDFSVAYTLGFASVVVAWLLGSTGLGVTACVLLTLVLCAAVGAVNGIVVVVFKIDSFIGTLATGSVLLSGIIMVSDNQVLTKGLQGHSFLDIAQLHWRNITIPVIYVLVGTVALWYVLGHTASGRRIYATGRSPEAARLAGVGTNRLRFTALVVGATLAGFAGILVTCQLGAGSPDIGPPYLIPAYAAAFLGLAQSPKRLFNAWGTLAAVVLLATTTQGLALAGAPLWAPYAFTGVVLIAAIGLSGLVRKGALPHTSTKAPTKR